MPADVAIAYLHPDDVSASFHGSLLDLISHDAAHNRRLSQWFRLECAAGGVPDGRNRAVRQFLGSDCEWLLFVDADMGFKGDILDMLLDVADPEARPIVGGLAFAARKVGSDDRNGNRTVPQVTIFDFVDHGDGCGPRLTGRNHYPPNTVTRCAGTGAAMLLTHRSVFEKIQATYGDVWFDRFRDKSGDLLGEDIAFFVRVAAHDLPVYVHTAAKTTHAKTVWLSDEDYWLTVIPPPATEECAVIVPVYRRPQNAKPFMVSLRASTGLATVYAVCDSSTDARAWREAGAEVVRTDRVSFACKVNDGYRNSHEPWLLLVGDDVRFHPGWLDHVQWVADDYGRSLVATNDMANARVMEGLHATHPAIRRSYVDEVGASWDGPGVVAHEGYRHWFVDDEWTLAAKARDQFIPAPGARIEHLHPLVGKAETDEVYELGAETWAEGKALFEQRAADALGSR